jgi:chromosome segregation ATPase
MEAVHNEAERLNRELAEVSSKVRSLYEKQNKNDTHINQLGVQIVEKQKKISEALRQAESRKQDEKERQRLEDSLPELTRKIADLSETIAESQLVVPTMEAEEQDLIKRQRDTETEHEHRLDRSRSNLGELSRMRNAIEE